MPEQELLWPDAHDPITILLSRRKWHFSAIRDEKTHFALAQQFDVHANQITRWKGLLLDGAASVFGPAVPALPATTAVDVKTLHARIGELTLPSVPTRTSRKFTLEGTRIEVSWLCPYQTSKRFPPVLVVGTTAPLLTQEPYPTFA